MGYYSELNQESMYPDEPAPDAPPAPSPASGEPQQGTVPTQEPAPAEPEPAPADDTAARQAHEAAEARRRAEWEAAQARKRAGEQEQLERIASMNEDALRLAAVRRISIATDKMTNRSMKDSVSAHIQSVCEHDLDFARLTMHPRKSMLHCIQYIFRQAQDYLSKELEAGGVKTAGTYGGDVPDGLCFQWAEDYFRDPDAKEDQEPDSQFVPKPYHKPYTPAPKPAPKPKGYVDGQISLMGEAS